MDGYQLMSSEQRALWDDLAERREHTSMRFTALDAATLRELEALAERLEQEYRKEAAH